MAKMFLDNAGIEYTTLIAEENAELANAYGIKEAPTLVMLGAEGATKISGPSDIKKFCESAVKA